MEKMGWRSRAVTAALLVLTGLFGLVVNDYGSGGWVFLAVCAAIAVAVAVV